MQRNNKIPDELRNGTLKRGLAILASDSNNELDPDEAASYLLRPGYLGIERCVAILESAGISAHRARQAVERQWSRYQDHLALDTTPGDWERFEAACDAITAHGVLVRHNFTCCRTCADEEIGDERGRERPEWGYVYFTQMDALDLAHERASVWLGYGSFGPSPRITAAELQRAQGNDASLTALYERTFDHLAEIVTAAVSGSGLRYDWDGHTQSRIKVVEMCWRRPLPIASELRRIPPLPRPQRFGFGFQ
ncbi:Uncharacterised protein [Mycobacteroides abscessus subsp. massiliense]|nr:Uncharacterised protein [Mycobacteroides abscessus subsp. massiliense]